MQTYLIIALVWIMSIGGATWFGYEQGDTAGANRKQVEVDKKISDYNDQIADIKRDAAAKIKAADDNAIKQMVLNTTLNRELENERAKHNSDNIAHRRELDAAGGLSIELAAKNSGCGASGGDALPTATGTTTVESTTVVELPRQITSDLRDQAQDEQSVHIDYAACYAYAERVRKYNAAQKLTE